MQTINVHEIKAKLSNYLGIVETGETVVICRRNVPIAQIVPIRQTRKTPRPVGLACDADHEIPESFFEPLPDGLLKAFNGEWFDPFLGNMSSQELLPRRAAEPVSHYNP